MKIIYYLNEISYKSYKGILGKAGIKKYEKDIDSKSKFDHVFNRMLNEIVRICPNSTLSPKTAVQIEFEFYYPLTNDLFNPIESIMREFDYEYILLSIYHENIFGWKETADMFANRDDMIFLPKLGLVIELK